MYARTQEWRGVAFYLLTRETIVLLDEKTSMCNCILRNLRCADYVLPNNFYINFLLQNIRIFKKLRADEVYVHVRVVLTRVNLYQ